MRGWAIAVVMVIVILVGAGAGYLLGVSSQRIATSVTTATISTSTIFPSSCGGMQEVREANLLFTNLTSTACVFITYRVNYHDGTYNGAYYPPGGLPNLGIKITKVQCYHNPNGTLGCSGAKDYSNSFIIATAPASVNITQIPINSTFGVLYLLRPLHNATGFYDTSFPKFPCVTYALAVGYPSNQVNGSGFSSYNSFVHSCFVSPYTIVSVTVANMGFKDVNFPPP
jgi:hypothetical protein